MRELLDGYFAEKKIEYFAVLDYRDCIEMSERIAQRAGFEPKTVIVYLAPYYVGKAENISCYATSLDYHLFLKEVGEGLCELLSSSFPGSSSRSYGDHSPINECHAAVVGGLGVIGDNCLLINERYGSYVFIGDVLTDVPPEQLFAKKPIPVSNCMHCGACKRACPTGMLRAESAVCLSAVTQRKGELSEDEKRMMRSCNTAWGCDVCQNSCPYNRSAAVTPIEFFHRERIPHLTRGSVDAMDKSEFSKRAFAWRGRTTVLRNLDVLEGEHEQCR